MNRQIHLRIIIKSIVILFLLVSLNCKSNGDRNNASNKEITLLNVSYDPTREMYQEFNQAFASYYMKEKGINVKIDQSHGGSGKQARSVIDGLEADVVTLALAYDIDEISNVGNLLNAEWQKEFPHNSSPYTSTIVFLVRKGNPKSIKDWDDLVRSGIAVITPNPKTSGGARWNYLAAWAFAKRKFNGDDNQIRQFINKLLKNVPVFDTGARGSTNTFVQRQIGDVLLAWENEAILVKNEVGKGNYDIVYPSISVIAEPPVAVVDKIAEKKGTKEVAKAYLDYLYSETGQQIVAKHFYRPVNEQVLSKYKTQFPDMQLVSVDEEFNGWQSAQKTHFIDGGTFDQIYSKDK